MTRQLASPLPVEVAPMRLPRPGKAVRRPDSGPRLRLEHLESREVPAAIGILDPSFGTGGKVAVFPTTGSIGGVAVDVAGRTVLAGSFPGAGLKNSLVVVKLTPDGSMVDPGFNGGAVKLIAFQFGVGSDTLGQSVVLSGSNIVVGGQTNNGAPGAPNQFAPTRLLANGNFD